MLSVTPPKDLKTNLQWRAFVRRRGDDSRRDRLRIIERCQHDICFYCDSFVWQFNPKKKGEHRIAPFILWPFQERALLDRPETTGKQGIIWCFDNDKTAVVEKSREMGASWLFLIFQDYLSLFTPYTQTLDISRSAEAVDCKSPNSLFWKLRFMHARLPPWITGKLLQQEMHIELPNGSVINGEASTGRAGVGGRAAIIFIDEFSQIKEDVQVRQRTASTADCRFFNGTHLGPSTEFYRLTQTPEIVKIQLHWTQHPDKNAGLYSFNQELNQLEYWHYDQESDCILPGNDYDYPPDYKFICDGTPTGGPHPGIRSPWYDWKCTDIGSTRGAAMELDIDTQGSQSQLFDPLVIRQLQEAFAHEPLWEGDLDFDRETGKPKCLVERAGGPFRLWINPTALGRVPPDVYGAGADISVGTGATPSCLTITNSKYLKVLEYASPIILPYDFGTLAVATCRLFQNQDSEGAKLAWEMQGPGVHFMNRVIELGYRNVYRREKEFELDKKISDKPGWYPSPDSTRGLLEQYRSSLSQREFINRSRIALEECLQFIYLPNGNVEHSNKASKDDPSGARVNHGDRVIADALSLKMVKSFGLGTPEAQEARVIHANSLAGRREFRENKRREEDAA